ncbi:MAG: serine hydrolase domain-containing protein [Kofleriaceae bacterium]
MKWAWLVVVAGCAAKHPEDQLMPPGVTDLAIVVEHHGEVVSSRGDLREKFPLASLSKQIWGVEVFRAGLDVEKELVGGIRLRDVMQQTSGLGDDHDGEDDVGFSDLETPAFAPGAWWRYSNRGAEIVRVQVRSHWATQVPPDVAERAGLADVSKVIGAELSVCERPDMAKLGFVCADATAVAAFENATDRMPFIGKLRAPVVVDGVSLPYGMLTRIATIGGHRAFGHTGNYDDVSVAAFRFPDDDLTIVVLEHGKPEPGSRAPELLERIAREQLSIPEPRAQEAPADERAAIDGAYELDGHPAHIIARNSHVVLSLGGDALIPLTYIGDRTFTGAPNGYQIQFLPATGPVKAAAIGLPFMLDGLARRKP